LFILCIYFINIYRNKYFYKVISLLYYDITYIAFYWWRKPEDPEKTTDLSEITAKVCQRLATDRWFSPDPPVTSTTKTDRHDITEILLKVTSNKQTKQTLLDRWFFAIVNSYVVIVFSNYLDQIMTEKYVCITLLPDIRMQ
jgi:hypothetical protein